MTLLSLKNLRVAFGSSQEYVEAVRGISFDIHRGETFGLVGESGSGKSVTAYSILRLLPTPPVTYPTGEIFYDGQDLLRASEVTLQQLRGDKISMIFQEPMTSLNPLHTIQRQISETLFLHGNYTQEEAKEKVCALLDLVQLREGPKRLNALPHQLSGGERQRVMIAMALAHQPDLLIADEPTTALDPRIQKEILDLLKDLQQKMNMAILFISHDLEVISYMCHRIGVMQEGLLVETGPTQEVLAHPKHPYTQMLLAATPKGNPAPLPRSIPDQPPVCAIQNLNVDFVLERGLWGRATALRKAVQNVTFAIAQGETVGVVGESGSGKTSLALAILRLISSTGTVRIQGQEIQNLSGKALRQVRPKFQMVFQDPFGSLNPRLTVGQIIGEGLKAHIHHLATRELQKRVMDSLSQVSLPADFYYRYPHTISGGQRQRVALARALILKPPFILLDEPTSALDRAHQAQLIDLLRGLQEKHGLAYLFISHDLRVVKALSHRILVMHDGQMQFYEAGEYFGDPLAT